MIRKLVSRIPFLREKNPATTPGFHHERRQDIVINNKVVKQANGNYPDPALRYAAIQEVLKRYERPFTLLDIGAEQGYYSFRTAHDYDCVCVMIEGDNVADPALGGRLLDFCHTNASLENIILFHKHIVPEDLTRLSECECFDVVLAFNVIHWFREQWMKVADAVLAMGDVALIETPPPENNVKEEENRRRKEIADYLLSRNAKVLKRLPQYKDGPMSTMYIVERQKNKILRKQWLIPKSDLSHLSITSNYKKKFITKTASNASIVQVNEWKPGINLITFLMYSGAHPSREQIKAAMQNIIDPAHTDWTVNNMILQGNELVLIDWDDPTFNHQNGRTSTPRVLKSHLDLVDLKNPKKIKRYFFKRLIKICS